MRRAKTRNPKVRVHANGKVTVSGLMTDDLSAILCCASIYHMNDPFVPKELPTDNPYLAEIVAHNNKVDEDWHKKMTWLIKTLKESLTQGKRGPRYPEPSLKEKLLANKEERDLIDSIIERALEAQKKLRRESKNGLS